MREHLNEVSFVCFSVVGVFSRFAYFDCHFNQIDWNRYYGEELYDHTIDPDEYINLYDRHEFAAIKLQLKHLLRTKLDN